VAQTLRTPDNRFEGLDGWDYEPRYCEADGLRIHYIDEGPSGQAPILLLHGEPTWSYLYRKMIAPLVAEGHRCVAIDLVGFGRSDKLDDRNEYTYATHLRWLTGAMDAIDLRDITLFCQDWGGLLGLRILAEQPDRFARVCASNTFLPTGDRDPGEGFKKWREYSQTTPTFHAGGIVKGGTVRPLSDSAIAAYDAPFPDNAYLEGARQFPVLVPITPDDPQAEPNRKAWESLQRFEGPFLTLFGDSDPVTKGGERVLQKLIPGTKDQPHAIIENAGHFIQEDAGEELAKHMLGWMS
jgi:haloalkane dehalogenase